MVVDCFKSVIDRAPLLNAALATLTVSFVDCFWALGRNVHCNTRHLMRYLVIPYSSSMTAELVHEWQQGTIENQSYWAAVMLFLDPDIASLYISLISWHSNDVSILLL